MAIPFAALADPPEHGHGRGEGRAVGHGGPGGGRSPGGGPPGWRGGPPPGWRGGGEPPGWRGGGGGRRDEEEGWDDRRFNGYWVGNRWYYGPPPDDAFDEPSFRPGFAPWRRGAFLPPFYQTQVVDEYWRFHLRRPPYGYHWVSVGQEFLLVSVTSGLIFDIVPGE